ncbi:ABC transporter permease [Arthrobacter sp. W4I7]|uniref:ABC transporter permease n=1 Tax=Arthrobacter sp. W4I7 TaxID=3042296 RepID=UPI00278A4A7D|nr:ABC transporter permease [Arthrobacter sp. W4I7]MDQ0691450.1 peptide/nickel transport system permease protein [Arthrobacter sp. W4I7]
MNKLDTPSSSDARRLLWRLSENRVALAALVFLALVALVALLAPILAPFDPDAQDLPRRLEGPSGRNLLGTDDYGRDQLSRLIYGSRISLLAALEVAVVSCGIGVPLGLVAGFSGRWVDAILSRINDGLMSVPALIMALTIVAVLGPGLTNAMLAVGVVFVPRFFRVTRAVTRDIRNETFVEASVALGNTRMRTVLGHVLPNTMSPIIIELSILAGTAITAEASLSFLGLGVSPPTASWGGMLSTALNNIGSAQHLVYPPGIMIAATVLACTLLGDGLRRASGRRSNVVGEAL